MADDNDTEFDDTENDAEGDGEESEDQVPQSRVNKLLADQKRKAERRAIRTASTKVEEKLGMSLDDAAAILAGLAERNESDKTETQRLAEEARAKLAEAQQIEERAAMVALRSDIESALRTPGGDRPALREDSLKRATQLVMADVMDSEDDPEDAIADAVAALHKDLPALFGTPAEADRKGGVGPAHGRTGGERRPAGGRQGKASVDRASSMVDRYKSRIRGRAPYRPGGQD